VRSLRVRLVPWSSATAWSWCAATHEFDETSVPAAWLSARRIVPRVSRRAGGRSSRRRGHHLVGPRQPPDPGSVPAAADTSTDSSRHPTPANPQHRFPPQATTGHSLGSGETRHARSNVTRPRPSGPSPFGDDAPCSQLVMTSNNAPNSAASPAHCGGCRSSWPATKSRSLGG
jgi:hypothetical protein